MNHGRNWLNTGNKILFIESGIQARFSHFKIFKTQKGNLYFILE